MTHDHPIEPELAGPTPRRVRYRVGGAGYGVWFVRLFILPHTLIGLGILGAALAFTGLYLGVWLFGDEYPAAVVKKEERRGSKGKRIYAVGYEYMAGGRLYVREERVGAEDYGQIAVGDQFTVRALEGAPEWRPWPRLPGATPLLELGGVWLFALLWNGIMSFFVYAVYLSPWRRRRLVRWGRPAPGIVRHTGVSWNTNTKTHHLRYEYAAATAAGESAVFTGKMSTTQADAAGARVGDVVTVLYDPRKPGRSLVYKYAEYRAG